MKLTYVVTFEFNETLTGPEIIHNYINMAIKKYHKLAEEIPGGGYFNDTWTPIVFISPVPAGHGWDDIREIIATIRYANEHIKKVGTPI